MIYIPIRTTADQGSMYSIHFRPWSRVWPIWGGRPPFDRPTLRMEAARGYAGSATLAASNSLHPYRGWQTPSHGIARGWQSWRKIHS